MAPNKAQVVIVGGGVGGASIAYHLAARGCADVLILEKEQAEISGTTARAVAGVRHQFSSEVNVRLSLESVRMIRSFTETHGLPLDVHVDGYLFVCRDEATWSRYRAAAAMQQRLGARVD